MILFLLLTCLVELAGIYTAKKYHNNHWVYNIFLLPEIGFTLLVISTLLKEYKKNNLIVLVGVVLLMALYFYEILDHGLFKYNNLTFTTMSVMFVLYSLYYYYLVLSDDKYLNLTSSPEFWWVAGVLFFYFGSTVCNIFYERLYSITIVSNHHLSYFVFKGLNIILYTCWSYSFICRKWQTKKLETSL